MATQEVLAPPARAAMFLVLTINEGDHSEAVLEFLADLAGLTRSVSFRVPDDNLNCVVGIGADLWDRVYQVPRPSGLHKFEAIKGAKHEAVSTPGDLLIHIRGRNQGPCFELARHITDRLSPIATVVDEVHGFRFFDQRDLLGFVDGTENPEGSDADAAVFVRDEDPIFAGSSYVIVQKYLHDLDTWHALSVTEQEGVVGRTKLEDIELPDAQKPSNSHVALNVVEDADGVELQIVRDNMPFGSVGTKEFGTYFIGYSADPAVTEQMLDNMFIGKPVGNYDRILDFSTAVTGSLYFVPTAAFLDDPEAVLSLYPPTPVEVPSVSDGSLGIGSLRQA